MKKSDHDKDIYAKKAKSEGYRSRAVYKIKEIDQTYKLIKRGHHILDLGAAPGSFAQYMIEKNAHITMIDLLPIKPLPGATIIQGDFFESIPDRLYDGIVSDMAPNTTGIRRVDHLKMTAMVEDIITLLPKYLRPGGFFVCKVFKGGLENDIVKDLKRLFKKVTFTKPKASRPASVEAYVVGMDFSGLS